MTHLIDTKTKQEKILNNKRKYKVFIPYKLIGKKEYYNAVSRWLSPQSYQIKERKC